MLFIGWRKVEPIFIRRDPLRTAQEVFDNPEARERITYAVDFAPPGTVFRWQKMLRVANRDIEPTEEIPDPLRLDLEMEELKRVLRMLYNDVVKVNSDGIALMRDLLPKMYDKHSLERGKRVSQTERDAKGITDECYAYGELYVEGFATIYSKVASTYGMFPERGVFIDLGCGVGNLVYAAAFIGDFIKVGGIDAIGALVERGEKRQRRWEANFDKLPKRMREMELMWETDNFLENTDFWGEGTFFLLHWTAFNKEQMRCMTALIEQCREGTYFVSFTNKIVSNNLEDLIDGQCETSWGLAEYFVQEKLSTRKKLEGKRDFDIEQTSSNAGKVAVSEEEQTAALMEDFMF